MSNQFINNSFFGSVANLSNNEIHEDPYIMDNLDPLAHSQITKNSDTTLANEQNLSDVPKTNDSKPDENDNSDMPSDARRALIYLSQQGVVLASQKPKLFATIVQHQPNIRRHLSELYCSLIIDEVSGIAFVARADFIAQNQEQLSGLDKFDEDIEQSELEGEDVSSLIQKRTLTVYDTVLLLNLRKYYQERQNLGETEIIIDVEKLENLMSPFLPLTDHGSRDKKKLTNRLDDFAKKHKLVIAKNGKGQNSQKYDSQERYEITPMIRYVVNASLLRAMLDEYRALLGETIAEDFAYQPKDSDEIITIGLISDTLTINTAYQPASPESPELKVAIQQDSLF